MAGLRRMAAITMAITVFAAPGRRWPNRGYDRPGNPGLRNQRLRPGLSRLRTRARAELGAPTPRPRPHAGYPAGGAQEALYPALSRLEHPGLIESEWGESGETTGGRSATE